MTDATPINRPDRQYVPWFRRCVPGWRTITVAAFLILATPLGIRWYRLWWMPDVPVPFDVEAFDELPVIEENAFTYFRKALYQHRRMPHDQEFWERFDQQQGYVTWDELPEPMQQWVVAEQPALELFRHGGRCSMGVFISPRSYSINTPTSVQQELRDLCRLALFDVVRLLDEEKTREAAEVMHDSFRAHRHLGRRGCLLERLIGIGCHGFLAPVWHQWSRHPHVTAEELEAALDRVREDWKLTPPPSDNFLVEYLMIVNETKPPLTALRAAFDSEIDRLAVRRLGLSAQQMIAKLNALVPGWQTLILWTIGEPEMSARAARLYLTHELKTCDLPYQQQPPRTPGPFELCRTPDQTAGLTAEELSQRIQGSFFLDLSAAWGQILRAIRNEAGRQVLLETELILQTHIRRERVQSRNELEGLLANFSWPADPCSASGHSLQHRAEDDGLVMWSVGWDGVDQGGVTDTAVNRGQDSVVVIPWPPVTPK